jgi:hypothetical protein
VSTLTYEAAPETEMLDEVADKRIADLEVQLPPPG